MVLNLGYIQKYPSNNADASIPPSRNSDLTSLGNCLGTRNFQSITQRIPMTAEKHSLSLVILQIHKVENHWSKRKFINLKGEFIWTWRKDISKEMYETVREGAWSGARGRRPRLGSNGWTLWERSAKELRLTRLENFRAQHPSPTFCLPAVLNGCNFLPCKWVTCSRSKWLLLGLREESCTWGYLPGDEYIVF